jgi:hypothetical protein
LAQQEAGHARINPEQQCQINIRFLKKKLLLNFLLKKQIVEIHVTLSLWIVVTSAQLEAVSMGGVERYGQPRAICMASCMELVKLATLVSSKSSTMKFPAVM